MNLPRTTIFALATPPGKAALAVMRVSGPRAAKILSALSHDRTFAPGRAHLCALYAPDSDNPFDQALVLWFAKPSSYTGEDVFELHLHGGPAVVEGAAQALLALGAAPAGPGEFTRRAFENGKLDLVQAEAVADLIDARTAAQRQQARRQLAGALGTLYRQWRARLDDIRARIEACIDFPEEEDVLTGMLSGLRPKTRDLITQMQAHLHDRHRGERIRNGLTIVLFGPVNAGKSTLLNRLSGEQAAIVSEQPGTTRDIVRVTLDLGGFLVELADSAGLRETPEPVEREGVSRAMALARTADIRLFVLDMTQARNLEADVQALAQNDDFLLLNKCDQMPNIPKGPLKNKRFPGQTLAIGARDGLAVNTLLAALQSKVSILLSAQEAPGLTRARHRLALEDCARALDAALSHLPDRPELAGEEMREAGAALGQITGESNTEAILERIFSAFCIGK